MPVTGLHVSDFHLRVGDPYDRDVVLGALVRSVRELRERQGRKPDLIFATGDVGHSEKAAEYGPATAFFDALLDAAALERCHLFVIPGNHDADRDLGIGLARTLGSAEDADSYFRPEIPKPHLTQKLGAFRDWYNQYFRGIRELLADTTCGPVEVADIRGVRVGVLPLNSALFCMDDHDHNKLILGRRCLQGEIDRLRQLDVHGRVDHASLGSSLHCVGFCLSRVGEIAEARPWYERAVEAEQGDVHGRVDHESLGRSRRALDLCSRQVGRPGEPQT